eukprot:448719-Rhodomonas_salina.1
MMRVTSSIGAPVTEPTAKRCRHSDGRIPTALRQNALASGAQQTGGEKGDIAACFDNIISAGLAARLIPKGSFLLMSHVNSSLRSTVLQYAPSMDLCIKHKIGGVGGCREHNNSHGESLQKYRRRTRREVKGCLPCAMRRLFDRLGPKTSVGILMRRVHSSAQADVIAAVEVLHAEMRVPIARWYWWNPVDEPRCTGATRSKGVGLHAGAIAQAMGSMQLDALNLDLRVPVARYREIMQAVLMAPFLRSLRMA